MKRFTATEKWADSWFRKLSLLDKAFWSFICDHCDNSGVWKVDLEAVEFFLDSKLDEKKLLATFAGRIKDVGRGRWWVTGFIKFQYGPLSESCIPHKKIIARLHEHGLYEEYLSTLQSRVETTLKEEEEEEDKEEEEERKGSPEGEPPPDPSNPHKLSGLGLRISGWFKRRPSTQWTDRELRELRKVEALKTPEDDLLLLEQRYLSGAPYIRKEILTLLNNWNGEIDRARVPEALSKPPQQAIPGWKRLDIIGDKIKSLNSEFACDHDEGRRQAIREEIQMLRAEKADLESKNGGLGK